MLCLSISFGRLSGSKVVCGHEKPGPDEIVHQTVTDLSVHYREDTSNSYSQVTIQPEGVTVDVSITS